jgi:hypothetical protein
MNDNSISKVFAVLPSELREQLISAYRDISLNYLEGKWQPSELSGGKLCEILYWISHGSLTGQYVLKATKPSNIVDLCNALPMLPNTSGVVGSRSFKILIPRLILPLYEIRNNRSVGHVGGDVNPNKMDATAVYYMSSWAMAELVRIFHSVSTKQAQEIVDVLVERKYPLIWEKDGIKRVLDPKMGMPDKTILFLYSEEGWVNESVLLKWTEHSNLSAFRNDVLKRLHKSKEIEYIKDTGEVHILPPGIDRAESLIKKTT